MRNTIMLNKKLNNNITLSGTINNLKKIVKLKLLNFYNLSKDLEAFQQNDFSLPTYKTNEKYISSLTSLNSTSVDTLKFLLKKYDQVQKLTKLYATKLNKLRSATKMLPQIKPSFRNLPRKMIPQYGEFMLFLKKRKNNFFINLHLYNGKLLYTNSVGKVNFTGPKRSTLYGLEELTKRASMFLFENRINYIRIFITSKVNKRINRVIKLLKYHYPKLRYIINKVIKYQHSTGLRQRKLRRV